MKCNDVRNFVIGAACLYGFYRVGVEIGKVKMMQSVMGYINERHSARKNLREEIILDTRDDVEYVIDGLKEVINTYGKASVADLFDLVDIPTEFTDTKIGWTDLPMFKIDKIRGGYRLELPTPCAIK